MSTSLSPKELSYWLAISRLKTIGPLRWQKLLSHFQLMERAWYANPQELMRAGLEPAIAEKINHQKKTIDPKLEYETFCQSSCQVISCLDNDYPQTLKKIYAPPPLLFFQGNISDNTTAIAIVGTRSMTAYGKRVTTEIGFDLAKAGVTIVSGLALGIDTCAHQTAIDAQGKTIAVLGSGADRIYPASNTRLAQKIINGFGAIVSEFPLGTIPHKSHFPQRNRIIAGISQAVIVTEAAQKSGALITAMFAMEENREVCAVPGPIYHPGSQGPHQLIANGAKLINCAQDVIELLNLKNIKTQKTIINSYPETETEKIIHQLIKSEALHVDKISRLTKLDISTINATLTVMEIKGLVKQMANNQYISC